MRFQIENCFSDMVVMILMNNIQHPGLRTFVTKWKPSSFDDLLERLTNVIIKDYKIVA